MSVVSHLGKDERFVRDSQRPVLTGEQSAAERIVQDLILAAQNARFEGGVVPNGLLPGQRAKDCGVEQYSSVDEYDAVLASHCRLNGDRDR